MDSTRFRHVAVAPDGKIFFSKQGEAQTLPVAGSETMCADGECFHYGDVVAYPCSVPLENTESCALRQAYPALSEEDYRAAVKGLELVNWSRTVRYCSACGSALQRTGEICKRCPDCGREYFPTPAPAVLVLVRDGERALLVHARNFSRPFFGLVAGFVESGESLEECVAREVREETSLEIGNIRYFGSQPFPYPFQLMVGFTADYLGGDLRFADGELTEGGFFRRDNVPAIPLPGSLAREMIDSWLNNGR